MVTKSFGLVALPGTALLGLGFSHASLPSSPAGSVCPPAGETAAAAGLVFGDVDGDGLDDAFVVGADGQARLLMNFGEGRFEDVTLTANLAGLGGASCALFADLDGDGRVDLFTGSSETRLWRNLGNATFEPMPSGIDHDLVDLAAKAVDQDQDGRLDLQIHTEAGDLVYRNLGEGRFERVELPLGALPGAPSQHVGWVAPEPADSADPLAAPEAGTPAERRLGRWVQGRGLGGFAGTTTSASSGASSVGPSLPFLATCQPGVRDANSAACIGASSVPMLGKLYPLSSNLFVAPDGKVGIGTSSPREQLHVDVTGGRALLDGGLAVPSSATWIDEDLQVIDTDAQVALISDSSGGSSGNFAMKRVDGAGIVVDVWELTKVNDGSMQFRYGTSAVAGNNPTMMTLAGSGSVGIGTTSPGARLEVAGTVRVTDTLTLAPSGDVSLDLTTGSIQKGGALFIHSRGGGFTTAIGRNALKANTTGHRNTASGSFALYSNTTGHRNTASGGFALYSNTTGFRNTALGLSTLRYNTTGSKNTASGADALRSNTTGADNTASGAYALITNTTGSRNTADGAAALLLNTTGNDNTASGCNALLSNTTGIGNTADGMDALRSNTRGDGNTASGAGALRSNTTGFQNAAIGTEALYSNTTGGTNAASGARALRSNTTGFGNMASGADALYSNTMGFFNTASGSGALYYNTTGSRNTASGVGALYANTTGMNNTASGSLALVDNTSGSNNIAIGYLAGGNLTTGNDNIAIGNSGVAAEAATIRLGTSGTHTRAFIAGIRGVTTGVANAIPVMVDSAGQLGTVSSSRRFKEEISDMGSLTERLLELRPVTFRYKPEVQAGERPLEYGLIAEEVAEVFPDLVVYDDEGKPFTVKYHLLSAMLLNELEKLHEQSGEQGRELQGLAGRIAAIEVRVTPPAPPTSR